MRFCWLGVVLEHDLRVARPREQPEGCGTSFLPAPSAPHERVSNPVLYERKHLEQIEHDGRVLFSIKYLWWLVRYGYWLNPYEIEARKAEGSP